MKMYEGKDIQTDRFFEVMLTIQSSGFVPERGDIAQLGEHLPCKQGVRSSNLLISTSSRVYLHQA